MRRIALLAAGTALLLLAAPAAQAGELTDTCRSTEIGVVLQGPCRGAEQVSSALAAHCRYATGRDEDCSSVPLAPRVVRAEIAEHEASWLHRALASQYELGSGVAMIDAPWAGTHNSFNSVRQMPALSETDANQQLTLTQQLRLDMRSLEIDLHSFRDRPVVCHGEGQGIGCTTERVLVGVIDELRRWLDAHPDQVLLLYLEDHLKPGHERRAVARLAARLKVLPAAGNDLATLTRDAVRAAGRQVVLVGGSGSTVEWRGYVFGWDPIEWEDRPHGFAGCANDGVVPPYRTDMVRFYEDSTWLTHQAEIAGQSRTDDGLRPETVSEMVRCGVDLFGFDQLVPGDPRLPALVWSWAEGQEPGPCAVLGAAGRWLSDCAGERRVACRGAEGWFVPATVVGRAEATAVCAEAGGEFVPPRTGAENAELAGAAPAGVWIGV